MKVRPTLLVLFILGFVWIGLLFANKSLPPTGYNGILDGATIPSADTNNCGTCHRAATAVRDNAMLTFGGFPSQWVPGWTYPLSINVTKMGSASYGFQLSAVKDTRTQPTTGGLSNTDPSTTLTDAKLMLKVSPDPTGNTKGPANVQYMEHSVRLTTPVTVYWTAPSLSENYTGTIQYNIAAVADTGLATTDALSHITDDTVALKASLIPRDTTTPISIFEPTGGATVSGSVVVSAAVSPNILNARSVQFKRDGATNLGAAVTVAPYSVAWDTTTVSNGPHTLTAVVSDIAGFTISSTNVTVTVDNGPTLTNINPSSGSQGLSVNVTLTGTKFIPGLTVNAGTGITASNITIVNPSTATATLAISGSATLGAHTVTITTTNGTTGTQTFNVLPPPPTLAGINPPAGIPGATLPVTLTGTNFNSGLTVNVGANIIVSNISVTNSSTATATFAIASGAALGLRNVSVTTPSGTSGTVAFTVQAPSAPTVSRISPSVGSQGATFSVVLTGTNFVSGLNVGSVAGITVTNVSVTDTTTATATFAISASATLGSRNITVITTGGTSVAVSFAVQSPLQPTLTSISPPSGSPGDGMSVTLTGTNFVSGLSVGAIAGITVTGLSVANTTTATATLSITSGAVSGVRNVTISTLGGTSNAVPFTVSLPKSKRDFDLDGKEDILWRDTAGNVFIWLMNGFTVNKNSLIANIWTGWTIAGASDFNGDGKADILWRDPAGNMAIWLMDGTTISGASSIGIAPTSSTVAGIADFNGDGKADILWRDTAGNVFVWLMNGFTVNTNSLIANIWTGWTIAGVSDFNGDGKADILWRDTAGNVAIWMMDGPTVSSYGSLGNVADRMAQ